MSKKMTANIIMTYINNVPVNLEQALYHSVFNCSCLKFNNSKETIVYKEVGRSLIL